MYVCIFPFLTLALQQVSSLTTNILHKKFTNLHTVVEALYTYEIPFDHKIKRAAASVHNTRK